MSDPAPKPAPAPADANAAPAAAPAKPKGSKLILVVAALSVVNLGGTGFVAFKSMHPVIVQAPAESSHEHHEENGPTASLDAFVVNLNEPGSTRYLKTSFEVELSNQTAADLLTKSKPAVRDELLRYLSSLSVADTLGENAKTKIQSEMLARVDKVLGSGRAKKLFFNEFVVQ